MFELKLRKISGRSLDISTKGSMVCHRQKKHHTILEECEKSLGYHQNEPPVLIYVWNEVLEESVEGVQIAVPKMQRYATIKRNITPSSKNARRVWDIIKMSHQFWSMFEMKFWKNRWKEFRYQYQRCKGMPPSKETSHHPRKMREEFGISSKWATSFDLCLKWSFGRISGRSSDSSTKRNEPIKWNTTDLIS